MVSKLKSSRQVSASTILLVVLFTGITTVLNIFLFLQNRSLAKLVNNGEMSLQIGRKLEPISGENLNEGLEEINWGQDNRKTLLIVFSNRCGYCHQSIPMWQKIIRQVDKNNFRLVGVSAVAEGTEEFVKSSGMSDFRIIKVPDAKSYNAYHFNATPQILLINNEGMLEKMWMGQVQPSQISSLEESLGVEL